MAAAVDEDVPSGAVGARAAEPLRCVTLLQGALVLLHGQAVVGQAQFLVSCLGVQLEGLTWRETEDQVSTGQSSLLLIIMQKICSFKTRGAIVWEINLLNNVF